MKKWLTRLTIGACVLSLSLIVGGAASAETIELKMSHFMPTKHVQHVKVMEPWAKKIGALTDGRVKVTIFPGGALGKPPQQYDSALKGITRYRLWIAVLYPGTLSVDIIPATSFYGKKR